MFCSWVCPFNIFEDLTIWINKRFKLKSSFTINRKLRYGILGLGILLSMILRYAAFEAISPLGIFQRGIIFEISGNLSIIIAIFLFDTAIVRNGWCGHLCPLGAFYAIIGKYSIIKVKYNKEACTSCMKCFSVCPEKQVLSIVNIESGLIKSGECTNCSRCIEVCDDKALKLSNRLINTKNTMK